MLVPVRYWVFPFSSLDFTRIYLSDLGCVLSVGVRQSAINATNKNTWFYRFSCFIAIDYNTNYTLSLTSSVFFIQDSSFLWIFIKHNRSILIFTRCSRFERQKQNVVFSLNMVAKPQNWKLTFINKKVKKKLWVDFLTYIFE